MGAGRKIENEIDARGCLLAAERSGRTTAEWARAHGVDGRSLHAWKVNFARGGSGAARPVPRVPRPATAAAPKRELIELVPAEANGASARYVLDVGGARLEFGDDVSVTTLRRVLEALRGC